MASIINVLVVLFFVISLCESEEYKAKMLVVGKTGTGKSTLVNGLLGRKVAKVGDELESETLDVEYYEASYPDLNTTIQVCDSPGFQDLRDGDYVKKIKDKCSNPAVILLCISMRDTRWTKDTDETIQKVTSALGKGIWLNAVLVLTFANEFNEEEIKTKKIKFTKKLYQTLIEEVKVDKDIVENIQPAVAGIASQRDLPGVKDWLARLYVSCFKKVKPSGNEAFYNMFLNRRETLRTAKGWYCTIVEAFYGPTEYCSN